MVLVLLNPSKLLRYFNIMLKSDKIIIGGVLAGAALVALSGDSLPIADTVQISFYPGTENTPPHIGVTVNGMEFAGVRLMINGKMITESFLGSNGQYDFIFITGQHLHPGENRAWFVFLDANHHPFAKSRDYIITYEVS